MTILWTYEDQQRIKPFSENNYKKFDELARSTMVKDLKPLLGFDMFQDIIQNSTTTANKKLLDGGTYTYNGLTYTFEGLKYVLAFFFHANYVMDNLQDTFHGYVTQNTEDSTAASSGDKKNLRDMSRDIALKHWEDCRYFIECNSPDYPYYIFRKRNNKIITL